MDGISASLEVFKRLCKVGCGCLTQVAKDNRRWVGPQLGQSSLLPSDRERRQPVLLYRQGGLSRITRKLWLLVNCPWRYRRRMESLVVWFSRSCEWVWRMWNETVDERGSASNRFHAFFSPITLRS